MSEVALGHRCPREEDREIARALGKSKGGVPEGCPADAGLTSIRRVVGQAGLVRPLGPAVRRHPSRRPSWPTLGRAPSLSVAGRAPSPTVVPATAVRKLDRSELILATKEQIGHGRSLSAVYPALGGRDKASLDVFWLRDESLEDTDNLPPPEAIAAEIVEDLTAALAKFAAVAESLSRPTIR